ncbi:MAG TPA: hypothetical protein VF212_05490 [Longimicrobiales bacterium]
MRKCPRAIPPVRATISPDGLSLYFASDRPRDGGDEPDDLDLYVARRASRDAPWGRAANLGPRINSSALEHSVAFSPDGLTMYFASNRPGGCGKHDICVSAREDLWITRWDAAAGRWAVPVNAGPGINTEYDEEMPSITHDGFELFFPSDRPGGLGRQDLYVALRVSA